QVPVMLGTGMRSTRVKAALESAVPMGGSVGAGAGAGSCAQAPATASASVVRMVVRAENIMRVRWWCGEKEKNPAPKSDWSISSSVPAGVTQLMQGQTE